MATYFTSMSSLESFDDLRPRRRSKLISNSSSPRGLAGETSPTSQDSSDSNGILSLSPTTSMTKLHNGRTRSSSNSDASSFSTYSSSSVSSNNSSSSGSLSARRNSPTLFDSPQHQHLEKTIRQVSKNYVINIEHFLSNNSNNHDEYESFKEFLHTECNLAPLEFYEKVNEFKSNTCERKELAGYLIKNYIKERSNNEINIANSVREVILKEYKECKQGNGCVSSNVFEKAWNEVKLSLKNDSFTRFISSDQFNKLILKKFNQIASNKSLDSNNSILEILESIFESIGSLSPLSSPNHAVNKSLNTIVNSQITVTPPNE